MKEGESLVHPKLICRDVVTGRKWNDGTSGEVTLSLMTGAGWNLEAIERVNLSRGWN